MKTNVLGVEFDNYTNLETLALLKSFLAENKNRIIITANPEIVMAARSDAELSRVLSKADAVLPDGIGVVIASRILGGGIKERVSGCDTVQTLFENVSATVYLLGGKPGVCEKAKQNIEAKYNGITVCGTHDGYFDSAEELRIIEEIETLKPDILLVGIGFPKQEKWIYSHRTLPVKISIGVGGTLDILAGTVKRAPVFFQKTGLEWFYRLLSQPSRIGRMSVLPVFLVKVFCKKIKSIYNGGA